MKIYYYFKIMCLCCLLIFAAITSLQAQERTLSGKVTDNDDEPLPGVNIVIKGTDQGTITDEMGNYSLTVPGQESILVFSFVGYKNKEIRVGAKSTINVSMEAEVGSLEEVVVTGYGTTKKQDVTGAVKSISGEDIAQRGTTQPLGGLQGQISGVSINQNSGLPGSGFEMNIRGVNSLSGESNPLFVVDGVMMDNIDFLNPQDIQQIDVLKDASATAIYGSRGSNGVVIVTTKSGEGYEGEAMVSYSGTVGLRTFSNMPDFLNAEEGINYKKNRGITDRLYNGEPLNDPDDLFGFPTGEDREYWLNVIENENHTNWVDLLAKPSVQTNHFISARGGNENVNYMVGAGLQGDNGNIEGQNFTKYNFKANVNTNISENWAMGANINLSHSERNLRSGSLMQQLFRMPNFAPAHDENGEMIQLPLRGFSGNVSPLAEKKHNRFQVVQDYIVSNFFLEHSPFEWMTIRSTFMPNVTLSKTGSYWDELATTTGNGGQYRKTEDFSYIWDSKLSIDKSFNEHNFRYDFVYSMQMDKTDDLYGFGWNLPYNSEFYNLGTADFLNTSSDYTRAALRSYTNRLNYNYDNRYLLTATARWDGSSKLAPGNKWAFFPSAAVAWRMSEESFLQETPEVSSLKLRLSYGHTGNNNIAPYTTQFSVNNETYYDWNGTVAKGFRPNEIANKELTWERTREWNLGLDFGFYDERITGGINVYDKKSLNLLMSRKLAVPTGWGSMMDNVGSLSNKGVEVDLRTINIQTSDFSWETNFTFSSNKNEILSLHGQKEDDVPNRWFIGEPAEVVYAMEYDGVWQEDELSESEQQTMEGTAKVKDLDNDGTIDVENDMKVMGSPLPKWVGGLSTTFKYKNWDLSASFYTEQGIFMFSPFHEEYTDFNSEQILDVDYYMRDNPYGRT